MSLSMNTERRRLVRPTEPCFDYFATHIFNIVLPVHFLKPLRPLFHLLLDFWDGVGKHGPAETQSLLPEKDDTVFSRFRYSFMDLALFTI